MISIGVCEIENFLSVKKKKASEWTTRKYYSSLATAFEKAVHWEYLKINPFKKVKKPNPPETLPVFFSMEEFNTLILCITEIDFRELCHTAIHTGLRLGEILSLRWKNVDFTVKTIHIRNSETFTTKSRKNRVVSLDEELVRVLKNKKITYVMKVTLYSMIKKVISKRRKLYLGNLKNMSVVPILLISSVFIRLGIRSRLHWRC